MTGTPRWSPDGRQIAFDARPHGHADIYVVAAEGGPPRRLTLEASNDVVPSWSRDGRWVYFASNRSGSRQVWTVPAEGGPAVQVTRGGGFAAFESLDGRTVYFARFDAPGLWRMPVGGGEETLVLDRLQPGYWGYWGLSKRGIYLLDTTSGPRPEIKLFDPATRRLTRVAVLDKEPCQWSPGLGASPDGRWVLYCQVDQIGSDIMMVENFQ